MAETEHSERTALPLAQAAMQLGLTPDALRMRLKRGRAKGFKRSGRVFVYLDSHRPRSGRGRDRTTEQPESVRFEAGEQRRAAGSDRNQRKSAADPGSRSETGVGQAPEQAMPVVVEFQRLELNRLLRENSRLNQRLDQMMDEIRHLREMQQREQILRQRDQTLRGQVQDILDRLTHHPVLSDEPSVRDAPPAKPPATPAAEPRPEAPEDVPASRGAETQPPSPQMTAPAATPLAETVPTEAEGPRPGEETPAPAASQPKVDVPPAAPNAEASSEAAGAPTAEPPEDPEPAYAYEGRNKEEQTDSEISFGTTPADAEELAEILKGLGSLLRSIEPAPPLPEAAAERRTPAFHDPTPPDPAADDAQRHGAARPGPAPAIVPPAARAGPAEDEGRLLEILGRMGPSAEDRRSAARIMKRLLGGRRSGGPSDPGDLPSDPDRPG